MSVIESMKKEDKCVIYSLGIFDDSSWEKDMIDRTNCQVYAFDASVNGVAGGKSDPLLHYHSGSFFLFQLADIHPVIVITEC